MSHQLRLAFGKIVMKPHEKEINIIDHSYSVLDKTKAERSNVKSSAIFSFLEIEIKEINGQRCLIGSYGYDLGKKYPVITDKKTISEQNYPEPPFQSKAIFIILESGYILFEEKTEQYIKPEKIKDAIESAYRAYAYEIPVTIKFLKLTENLDTMVEFVLSLKKLISIEFSNLKHSNPSEVSEFFDEATIARIDSITESSNDPKGIDRENQEFKKQLKHVRKYGKLRKAMGDAADGFRVMELVQDEIRLTVTLPDQEAGTKISKMIDVFKQILQKLTGE